MMSHWCVVATQVSAKKQLCTTGVGNKINYHHGPSQFLDLGNLTNLTLYQ